MTMIDLKKPVTTRNGLRVEIYTDKGLNDHYPIVGEYVNHMGGICVTCWTEEGKYLDGPGQNDYDLINPPQRVTIYFNIYRSCLEKYSAIGHNTVADAHQSAGQDVFKLAVPIEVEV